MVIPFRALMASGAIEKATGYTVNGRKFGGGGDVIRAMASGNVQIGEAGSSPIAAAASQGLDIQLFWILDAIADAEQPVARNGGVTRVADLRGKTIAVPFVSMPHYQLIAAPAEAGLTEADVRIPTRRETLLKLIPKLKNVPASDSAIAMGDVQEARREQKALRRSG